MECMKDKQCRSQMIEITGRILKSEIQKLCSDNHNSILLRCEANDMKSSNYSTVITEAKSCALDLTELLYKCAMTPVLRNNTDAVVSTIMYAGQTSS